MKARGLAALAALGGVVVATAAPGWATPAAPEPTSSVATYVQGQRLPASVATAAWSHVVLGCAGHWTVSGPSVSGATTIATGAMTSRWFRPRHGTLLSMSADQGGNRLWQPFPEGFDLKVRVRDRHNAWSPWFGMSMMLTPSSPPLPGVIFSVSGGGGFTLGEISRDGRPLPPQQVQVKLRDAATSTGTLDDAFAVKIGC
jgi:hypothetical protein